MHCLFKLFCLKDRVVHAFISRVESIVPVSTENVTDNTNAMDIEKDLKSPTHTSSKNMSNEVKKKVDNKQDKSHQAKNS